MTYWRYYTKKTTRVPHDAVRALHLRRDLLRDHGDELERKLHDAGLDELLRRDRADADHVAERARAVLDADGLDVRHDREELLRLLVELRLVHLVAEDEVRLAEDVELLLGELADAADREAGPRERLAHDHLLGEAEELADLADLVLVEVLHGLDKALEEDVLRKPADVVVRLHGLVPAHARLDDVGVDRALPEEVDVAVLLLEVARGVREDLDELAADDLALRLRIGHALRLVEEALLAVERDEVHAELALEDLLDHLALVEAHAAVVDEHADELPADRLVEERRADGRVDAAGKRQQHLPVADLLADRLYLVLDVLLRVEGLSDLGKTLFLSLVHVGSFRWLGCIIPKIGKRASPRRATSSSAPGRCPCSGCASGTSA